MIFGALKRKGVLGMNQRNAGLISRWNPRKLYPLVDDKLTTKQLAEKAGISVPPLYGVVRAYHELHHLFARLADYQDFVVKPAHGSGGNGILVISGRSGQQFIKASGQEISYEDLEYHVSNAISGMYSLGGQPDQAMIEYRVAFDPLFEHVAYRGVPDIRTLVYRGVPVMAMVRLPTQASDGRRTCTRGQWVSVSTWPPGKTMRRCSAATHASRASRHRPPLAGLAIPGWQELLVHGRALLRAHRAGLPRRRRGARRAHGPMMLELNARPGLASRSPTGTAWPVSPLRSTLIHGALLVHQVSAGA